VAGRFRSPSSTGLVNGDGVLYFAGDDATGLAFWAVDANSGGNDVVAALARSFCGCLG